MALRIPSRCNHAQQFGPHAYALRLTLAGLRRRKPLGVSLRACVIVAPYLIAERCALITMAHRIPSRCNHAQQFGPHAYALRLTLAGLRRRKPLGVSLRACVIVAPYLIAEANKGVKQTKVSGLIVA